MHTLIYFLLYEVKTKMPDFFTQDEIYWKATNQEFLARNILLMNVNCA